MTLCHKCCPYPNAGRLNCLIFNIFFNSGHFTQGAWNNLFFSAVFQNIRLVDKDISIPSNYLGLNKDLLTLHSLKFEIYTVVFNSFW